MDLTKKQLYDRTKCLPPCSYYKYKVVSKVSGQEGYGNCLHLLEYYQGIMSSPGFRFVLVTEEVTEEVEEYLYDELSLIAEFGGALGLFLGVSFLTLWDIGQSAVRVCRKFLKLK